MRWSRCCCGISPGAATAARWRRRYWRRRSMLASACSIPPRCTTDGHAVTMDQSISTTGQLLALGRDYQLPVYRPRELILERGRGSRVWDLEGREYIDFA